MPGQFPKLPVESPGTSSSPLYAMKPAPIAPSSIEESWPASCHRIVLADPWPDPPTLPGRPGQSVAVSQALHVARRLVPLVPLRC